MGNLFVSDAYNYRVQKFKCGLIQDSALNNFPASSLTIVDKVKPRIVAVEVFDSCGADGVAAGHDGKIDEIRVMMSEPISDVTVMAGEFKFGGDNLTLRAPAGVRHGKKDAANDNFITLVNFTAATQFTGTGVAARTLTLVADAVDDLAVAPNKNADQTFAAASITDFALPVVMNVPETMDADNDGKIDHLKIVFSESMNDSKISDIATVTTAGNGWGYLGVLDLTAVGTPAGDIANDATVYIKVTENTSSANTGVTGTLYSAGNPENHKFVAKWGTSGAGDTQFNTARDVAVDGRNGWLFVADTSNNRIVKYDLAGTYLKKWNGSAGVATFSFPVGVAVDSAGNVYVVERDGNRVQKFDCEGNYLTSWGSAGAGDGQFSQPRGIAIDSNDKVYVADTANNRIQRFDDNGGFIDKWASANVMDVTVDSAGNVYGVNNTGNLVSKYNSTGAFVSSFGTAGSDDGQFNNPCNLAVDMFDNLYVADSSNNRFQKFSPAGTFITKFGSTGAGDGQFQAPFGIAVDDNQNIYVCEGTNFRVQKLKSGLIQDSKANNYPSASLSIIDKSKPRIIAVEVFDACGSDGAAAGHDGKIDEIRVTMSETVSDATVAAGDFTFGGVNLKLRAPAAFPAGVQNGKKDAANDQFLTLVNVTEATQFDGTNINARDLVVLVDAVDDLAAAPNKNPAQTFAAAGIIDCAQPVVLTVETLDNNTNGKIDYLKYTLSEPVTDATYLNRTSSVTTGGDGAGKLGTLVTTAISNPGAPNADVANDNIFYMTVTENTTAYNTGVTVFETVQRVKIAVPYAVASRFGRHELFDAVAVVVFTARVKARMACYPAAFLHYRRDVRERALREKKVAGFRRDVDQQVGRVIPRQAYFIKRDRIIIGLLRRILGVRAGRLN
jgi:DNA-binding beta-propeller fold protein YncE